MHAKNATTLLLLLDGWSVKNGSDLPFPCGRERMAWLDRFLVHGGDRGHGYSKPFPCVWEGMRSMFAPISSLWEG